MKRQVRIAGGTCEADVSRDDRVIGWQGTITVTGAIVGNRNEQRSGTAAPASRTTHHVQRTTAALEANELACQRSGFELEQRSFSVRAEHVSFMPNRLSSQPIILPCSQTDRELCGTTFTSK